MPENKQTVGEAVSNLVVFHMSGADQVFIEQCERKVDEAVKRAVRTHALDREEIQ